jgi:hypothetical protein
MILDASELFKTKYTTSRGQARTKTSGCPDPAPGLITRRRRMPRIKRWFPVNHDINRDPEMWDLCNKFGDKALRCWLEILSIADRNEGDVPGTLNSISTAVGWAIRCRSTKTRRILDDMLTLNWLRFDECLKVTNYAKYHITRDSQKILLAPLPSEPSEPSEPIRSARSPSADLKGVKKKRELDPKIKEVTDRLYAAYPEKFKRCGVMAWIGEAQKYNFAADIIAAALKGFEPYAGTTHDWYPYLDKMIYGLDKNRNRDIHDIEHERNKQETAELAKDMFGDAQVKERAGPYRRRSVSRR